MSPYGQAPSTNLQLINQTIMPVIVGKEASGRLSRTKGQVTENSGTRVMVQ